MASGHATGSILLNQPSNPNIEETPGNSGNNSRNTTTSTRDNDPFTLREESPNRRQTGSRLNVDTIAQPSPPHFPLSPTTLDRHGERSHLDRQASYGPTQDAGTGIRLVDNQFIPRRQQTMDGNRQSAVPQSARVSRAISGYSGIEQEMPTTTTISERIRKTVEDAELERNKYAFKAKATGLALNIAIGLQVLLGSLTTGLSAVATRGRSAAVSTTILGAFATIVASYLARARGSNEPELSIARVKDLEQFLRECKNFETDHGLYTGHDLDHKLDQYRQRFENLLGNGNEERRMSST